MWLRVVTYSPAIRSSKYHDNCVKGHTPPLSSSLLVCWWWTHLGRAMKCLCVDLFNGGVWKQTLLLSDRTAGLYIQGDHSHRCDNLYITRLEVTLATLPMGQSADCPHISSGLFSLNGIRGGAGCRPLFKARMTGQSTCFTYCHLKPSMWQSPLNGCFACACACICFVCVTTSSHHSDTHWLTDLILHSQVRLSVCAASLLVICGWIKNSIDPAEFSQPSLEVMRSRLWFNHRCAALTGIDRKQRLFHNLQEDVMMILYTLACTHNQRNVMTLIIDFITSLSCGFHSDYRKPWVVDNLQIVCLRNNQESRKVAFLVGLSVVRYWSDWLHKRGSMAHVSEPGN